MTSNKRLRQTKPPVTVRADARPAPAVFAAETGVRLRSIGAIARTVLPRGSLLSSRGKRAHPGGTRVEVINIEQVIDVCRAHGTRKIALFGSFVRGEAGPDSDVDLLVEFSAPTGLLALVRLERELTEVLGRSVDLLTEEAISPHLRERILREQRVLYEAAH